MSLFNWMESKIQNMRWFDISFIKLSSAAFILMIAKLWSDILVLDWYWYAVIGIIAAIRPLTMMFKE
ncbi:MAG: hypothetical protein KJ674_02655 [Nanoarchaeota archaeon]|nr:hypothetical protein [Nanoarchaeota archaeon]